MAGQLGNGFCTFQEMENNEEPFNFMDYCKSHLSWSSRGNRVSALAPLRHTLSKNGERVFVAGWNNFRDRSLVSFHFPAPKSLREIRTSPDH